VCKKRREKGKERKERERKYRQEEDRKSNRVRKIERKKALEKVRESVCVCVWERETLLREDGYRIIWCFNVWMFYIFWDNKKSFKVLVRKRLFLTQKTTSKT
jgi:hypothetical protein